MSKLYNEIMEEIEVTEEMRERILKNIRTLGMIKQEDFEIETYKNSHKNRKNRKICWSGTAKKYLVAAACFVVLLVGIWIVPKIFQPENELPDPDTGLLSPVSDIAECSSIEELSEKTGVEIAELSEFPFRLQSAKYYAYWGELAQIEYLGEDGETVLYRKSKGEKDNSGDYNLYEVTAVVEMEDVNITLKGYGENYNLAIWQKDGYVSSLSFSEGMEKDKILPVIKSSFR